MSSQQAQSTGSAGSGWDALQSRFRRIEPRIFSKLSELSSLAVKCTRAAYTSSHTPTNRSGQYLATLGDQETKEGKTVKEYDQWAEEFRTKDTQLSSLLRDLQAVVDEMADFSKTKPLTDQQASFLERARSVLADSSIECRKSKESVTTALHKLKLFDDDDPQSSLEDGRTNSATENLLREHSSIQSSIGALDEVLEVASSSRATMGRKRDVLERIKGRMGRLSGMFPGVNQVINKIRKHKQRDTIILAFVIASCMFFTFLYVMWKS